MKRLPVLSTLLPVVAMKKLLTVITRIIGDINGQKALILNKKENTAPKMIVIVEKILRDVVRQVEENFDFG